MNYFLLNLFYYNINNIYYINLLYTYFLLLSASLISLDFELIFFPFCSKLERKEKNELISQVNILTKKILQLEKDLEQERNNNKKLQENKNNNPLRTPNPNANVNKPNNPPPPFHTSKSDTIPDILFKSFFGNFLGLPELGRKGRSKLHEHILVYSNYEMKDPGYSKGGYTCDNCGDDFTRDVDNFHCKPCGFDLCMKCFKQSQY